MDRGHEKNKTKYYIYITGANWRDRPTNKRITKRMKPSDWDNTTFIRTNNE